ncbi:MAG TPA: type II toxin-antitoxin system VapC family toxin [Chloroflexota bacterium]
MSYWDASAVVPLCVAQTASETVRSLTQSYPELVVWWATRIECASAFARLFREGVFTPDGLHGAGANLAELSNRWLEVVPSESLRNTANRLLYAHPLRADVALQLAAALDWCDGHPGDEVFICLDNRLREAAQREGFRVLPERL